MRVRSTAATAAAMTARAAAPRKTAEKPVADAGGSEGDGERAHRGLLHINPAGVLRLVASIRGDAFTARKRVVAVGRFVAFFTRGAARGMLRRA